MSKTLGQVAFEGWDSDVMSYKPWDEVPPGFQAAWQAAADAVVAQHMKELTGADEFQMGTFQIDNSKERALTHYYTDDEGVDHPLRTGTGGTLRDDDRIMAVIEAAKRAKDSIYYAQGHAEKLGIDWPGLEELLSVLDALDSEKE